MRVLALSVFLLGVTVVAQAQVPEQGGPSFALVLDLGVEYGGDHVATTFFTNGNEQKMLAGQGGTAALGVEVRPHRAHPLAGRATVGYKFVTTAADNASIRLTRIPIEVVGSYQLGRDVWAGAGYVHHAAVKYEGDGFAEDASFSGGHGVTAELGWRWFALTYTYMTYRLEEIDETFDASSVGVSAIIPLFRR